MLPETVRPPRDMFAPTLRGLRTELSSATALHLQASLGTLPLATSGPAIPLAVSMSPSHVPRKSRSLTSGQ
jgi:hypothetical protein